MSAETILFWLLSLLWAALLLIALKASLPPRAERIGELTLDALLLAIIALMGFVPEVGYLTIAPGLSLTFLHLPVLVGSYRGGWRRGLLLGSAFGLTSWAQAALTGVGFNAFFLVPWVSVLPRSLFGLGAGFCFDLLRKTPKLYGNPLAVGGLAFGLTLGHTALVFAALLLFYPVPILALFQGQGAGETGLALTFAGIIALGSLGEAAFAAFSTPALGKALAKTIRRK